MEKNMKRSLTVIKRYPIIVLPVLWLLFALLNILTNCIPDRLVKGSIASGLAQIKNEGDHPWVFFTPQSQLDNFTDAIMIQQSQRTSGWNSVTAYFADSSQWSTLESGAVHNPIYAAFANQGYPRYWHGYTLFLKPLLVVFNYSSIRIISFVVLTFLLCAAFSVVKDRFGLIAALCFTTSLVSINFFVVPMSLVFSPVTYITLLSICALKVFDSHTNRVLAFTVIGAFTNYTDFLTFPLLTLCFPLIFCVMYDAVYEKNMSLLKRFWIVIYSGLMWLIGYASTWFMKWVFSSIVIHQNVISDAIHSIMIRSDTGGVNEAQGESFNKIEVIQNNYRCLLANMPKRFMLLFVVLVIIILAYKFLRISSINEVVTRLISGSPILLISIAPVVWYAALSNHSAIHMEFFAYKNASITFLGILLYIVLLFSASSDENKKRRLVLADS